MALEITIRYGEEVAAFGRLEPGDTRLELNLPPLPADKVTGSLEVRVVDSAPPAAASASCISEWLRCGDAVLEGDRVTAPLAFDNGSTLGDKSRPHESTLYLTVGTALVRVVVRVPSLLPGVGTPAPTPQPVPPPPEAAAPLSPEAEARLDDNPLAVRTEPEAEVAEETTPPVELQPPVTPPADSGGPPPVTPPYTPPPPPGGTASPPTPGPGLPIPPPPGAAPGMPPYAAPGPPPAAGVPYGLPAPVGVCRNHPQIPTDQVCQWCRNPYCSQCLVEFRGSRLCGWCKQASMAQMQRSASQCDPRQVTLWSKVYNWVMVAGVVAVFAFRLALWSSFGGGPFDAPALMMFGYIPLGLALLMALPPALGLGPGRKWAYVWQMVMLIPSALLSCFWLSCLGLAFWPASIILLVYLTRPEVKDYLEQGT